MTAAELRQIRLKKGYTQEDVAAGSGVNVRTIVRMEKGEPVRPDTVKKVFAFYQIPYEDLGTITVVAPDRLMTHPRPSGWSRPRRRSPAPGSWSGRTA